MDWIKLLPDILRALPTSPIAVVALIALAIAFLVFKSLEPKVHHAVRVVALVVAIAALVTLAWMVVNIGKEAKRDNLEVLLACKVNVLSVLDDHKGSEGTYQLSVNIEGKNAFGASLLTRLPHGTPWGGPFTNWTTLAMEVSLPRRKVLQSALEFELQLGGSPEKDWIGVAHIEAECGERKFQATIEELHGYGPGGRRTGILYIGETKHWQALAVSE